MAKKVTKEPTLDELKELTKEHKEKVFITDALLWEWKHSLAKMKLNALNKDRVRTQKQGLLKDKEIIELKLKLFKDNIELADKMENAAKEDYEQVKKKLEKHIGFPVEDCVINDETLEVNRVSDLEKRVE